MLCNILPVCWELAQMCTHQQEVCGRGPGCRLHVRLQKVSRATRVYELGRDSAGGGAQGQKVVDRDVMLWKTRRKTLSH
jgi:hypothetical protein